MGKDNDVRLLAALRDLGYSLDVSNFKSRLILQKRIYLMQRCGLNVGVRFGWYVHGPYCTDLSHLAYRLSAVSHDKQIVDILPEFNEHEQEALSRAGSLFNEIESLDESKPASYWYELVGSILFLKDHKLGMSDVDSIFRFLEQKKPDRFERDDVERAFELIGRL